MLKTRAIVLFILFTMMAGTTLSYADRIDPINLTISIITLTQALQGHHIRHHRNQLLTVPLPTRYPCYSQQQQQQEPYYNEGYVPNRTYYEVNPPYTQPPMNDYEFSMKLQMCRAGNQAYCEALARRLLGY